jgi:nitroimidazol reductase NimA-like FMN-containing flavoprotein (pyridoxamine 5'-phosphate oxidase superfamily)
MTTGAPATELNEAASWALVRESVVGRLAVVVDGGPDIFPVNYVVDHGSVVLRTAAGTKLAAAVNQPVAFEVDGYDPSTGDAWSVVVKGVAREIKQLHEVVDALDLPLDTWHPAPKPRLLRIEPTAVTGRRFGRAEQPAARSAARAAHE